MYYVLGLIHSTIYRFSSRDCFSVLYITLVRPRLEYASVVWNSITSTDANKLERIQQKFTFVFLSFFPYVPYIYIYIYILLPWKNYAFILYARGDITLMFFSYPSLPLP
jgi:hypothetical protein